VYVQTPDEVELELVQAFAPEQVIVYPAKFKKEVCVD